MCMGSLPGFGRIRRMLSLVRYTPFVRSSLNIDCILIEHFEVLARGIIWEQILHTRVSDVTYLKFW